MSYIPFAERIQTPLSSSVTYTRPACPDTWLTNTALPVHSARSAIRESFPGCRSCPGRYDRRSHPLCIVYFCYVVCIAGSLGAMGSYSLCLSCTLLYFSSEYTGVGFTLIQVDLAALLRRHTPRTSRDGMHMSGCSRCAQLLSSQTVIRQ